MSASLTTYHGTPAPYLDALRDALWSVGVYAEQGQRYADLGDIAGLTYSVRALVAHARFVVSTAADLREMVERQRAAPECAEKVFSTKETA